MSPQTRRRLILVGVALVALVATGLAWWYAPGPRDVQQDLTPDPATIDVPELPPLDPDPPTDASDDTDPPVQDTAGDEVGIEGGGALPGMLGAGDSDPPATTDDGLPLRLPGGTAWVRHAVAPSEARPVALSLSSTALLAQLAGPDGSYVQILLPDLPERRVIRLDGVLDSQLPAARARSPVATAQGFALLAEDARGPAIWRVDLEVATATVLARPPGTRTLQHLRPAPQGLAVIADDSRVMTLRGGNWITVDQGPQGLDGLAVGTGPTLVTTRLGQVIVRPPSRTVGERLGPGREPVRLPGATAWIRGGDVVVHLDGAPEDEVVGRARALPGDDLAAAGSALVWMRTDGTLARLDLSRGLAVQAFVLPVSDVTALAAAQVDDQLQVAVAGRNDTVRQIEVVMVPE